MILISPFAKAMRDGKPHPKNYPWWPEVIAKIDEEVIQVGIEGELQLVPTFHKGLSLTELGELVQQCTTWLSVDTFLQHFCWDLQKPGIVIFGQSDPIIFGHPENINLLEDRKYLREKQFWLWEQISYNDECWVTPNKVLAELAKFNIKLK